MQHPFLGLDTAAFRRRYVPLLVATLAFAGFMGWVDARAKTEATPFGIVSFQVAREPLHAQWILETWSRGIGTNSWVAFGLGLDYLFMVLYSTLLSLSCVAVAERLSSSPAARTMGIGLAWASWLAAAFDAVENFAHFRMLVREPVERWIGVSFVCASAKWALLGASIAYAAVGFAASRFVKRPA
ncbi:MAG: hypothetical protein U0230_00180 [Polyangiales bacterium]